MVKSDGLEALILNDNRVTSEIERLSGKTLSEKGNPITLVSSFILNWLISRSSSKERLLRMAKNYFARMRSDTDPQIMKLTYILAEYVTTRAFSEVNVQGLDEVVGDVLKGKMAFYSTHFSYFDVGVLPYIFGQRGIRNVYYVGGDNVTNFPVLGMLLGHLLRNSGSIQIQRALKGKKQLLAKAVLQAYAAHLLNNGATVLNFAGRGRNRSEVEAVKASASGAVLTDADFVIPIAIAYDIVPEDRDFALGKSRRGRSVIEPLTRFIVRLISQKPYGAVYVTFGRSVPTAEYKAEYIGSEDSLGLKKFEAAVTQSVIRAVTVTPTSFLAALLEKSGLKEFTLEQVSVMAVQTLSQLTANESGDRKANIASPLKNNPADAMAYAALKLVETGALALDGKACKVKKPEIVHYYATKVTPTLRTFGISFSS